jgi:hypothetical protein
MEFLDVEEKKYIYDFLKDVKWIDLALDRDIWLVRVNMVKKTRVL